MSGRLFIEAKQVASSYQHLYLVFQNSNGKEFVIRGGPTKGSLVGNFGTIAVEDSVPIEDSKDEREELGEPVTPQQRNQREIDLGGRKASDVWEIARQQARNINSAKLDYNALFDAQNSNSTIASVLNAVGIDVKQNRPGNIKESRFPGITNLLDFPKTLVGTKATDIIFGGAANDTLSGEEENDQIKGNGGNDQIDGGEGEDTAIFSEAFENYELSVSNDGQTISVAHAAGTKADGTDTLKNIEFGEFQDRKIPLSGIDLVFVIDATGSMADDIEEIKVQASSIIDQTSNDIPLARFSVITYRDPGETRTIVPFTSDAEEATRGINDISVGGGGDIPEGVNSGLLHALRNEQEMGAWRSRPTPRKIILIGDAPAKDVELRDEVLELARREEITLDEQIIPDTLRTRSTSTSTESLPITKPALPINIFSIVIGDSVETSTDFQAVAQGTGGATFTAATAQDVVPSIREALKIGTFRTAATPDSINFAIGEKGIRRRGSRRSDKIAGTRDNDILLGLNGRDKASGKAGNDRIDGGNGNDELNGGSGRDLLQGFQGNDKLIGSQEDDVLVGGVGRDTLVSGSGVDVLVFNSLEEASDIIQDFQPDADLIDIRNIAVRPEFGTLGSFNGFTSLIQFVQVGADTEIHIDQDGTNPGNTFTTLATLKNVTVTAVSGLNFVV